MSGFKAFSHLDPKCDLAFRAQAAMAGVTADSPESTDDRDRLLEIRNGARKVANLIERKMQDKGYAFAQTDAEVLHAAGARIQYVNAALDMQDRNAGSPAKGASAGMVNIEGRHLPIITAADRGNVAKRFREAGIATAEEGNPETPTFDDFVRGVMGARVRPEVATQIKNSMSEGTGSAGGYTVPAIIMPQIIESLLPNSSLLQAGMQIVPLLGSGSSFAYPIEASVPTWAFLNEAATVTASDPSYTQATLTPRQARVQTNISRELLQDSVIGWNEAIQSVFSRSLAAFIDATGLTGSGTPPVPKGLINVSGLGSYAFGGANGTQAVDYTWPVTALTTLLAANAKGQFNVVCHPNQYMKLQGLKNTLNDALRAPTVLDGAKWCTSTALPINQTVGSSVDCSTAFVGSFPDMILGMRMDLQLLRADQVNAAQGQVAFFGFSRIDFAVLRPAQFVKVTGLRA